MPDEITPTEDADLMTSDEPWYRLFIKAVTKPNVATYEEIANHPDVSLGKALTWLFGASIIGGIISAILTTVFGLINSLISGGSAVDELAYSLGFGFGFLLCGIPIVMVLFVIFNGITHGIAKLLGGTGEFEQLLFTVATYTVPISIVTSIINSIPYIGFIGLFISLYAIALNVISVKAVHELDWGRSVAASLLIPIIFACLAVCVIVLLTLMGPAIGSVFSNVIEGLGP